MCPQVLLYHLIFYIILFTTQHWVPWLPSLLNLHLNFSTDHYPIIQSPFSAWPPSYHPISCFSLIIIPSSNLFFQPGEHPIIHSPLPPWSPFLHPTFLFQPDHPIIHPPLPASSPSHYSSSSSSLIIPSSNLMYQLGHYAILCISNFLLNIHPTYLFWWPGHLYFLFSIYHILLAYLSSMPPSNLLYRSISNLSIHSLDLLTIPLFIFHYHYSPTIHPSICCFAHYPSFPPPLCPCSLFLYLSPICNISQATPCTNTVSLYNYTNWVWIVFIILCKWFYLC